MCVAVLAATMTAAPTAIRCTWIPSRDESKMVQRRRIYLFIWLCVRCTLRANSYAARDIRILYAKFMQRFERRTKISGNLFRSVKWCVWAMVLQSSRWYDVRSPSNAQQRFAYALHTHTHTSVTLFHGISWKSCCGALRISYEVRAQSIDFDINVGCHFDKIRPHRFLLHFLLRDRMHFSISITPACGAGANCSF